MPTQKPPEIRAKHAIPHPRAQPYMVMSNGRLAMGNAGARFDARTSNRLRRLTNRQPCETIGMPTRLLLAIGLLLSLPLSSTPQSAAPQTDLDAFMARVLARRDDNWKKQQQYVLEERE